VASEANEYSAADITVLEFDEAVRKRPGMYFGVGPTDPRLATRVLSAVVGGAFHPPAKVAPVHSPVVVAEITADLAFSVTDNRADALTGEGTPRQGYYGSLLTSNRWKSAAASAVSARTTVDVWRDGRGLRQELAGLRPTGPPTEFAGPAGEGTRVAYLLDTGYLDPASAITTDLGGLDLHGPGCAPPAGPGSVLLRDLRTRAEHRFV
jgi:hypothetical protein